MATEQSIARVEDDEPHIGAEAVDRLLRKARPLHHLHAVNVNSAYYGEGSPRCRGHDPSLQQPRREDR